jgi:hypothetical protein
MCISQFSLDHLLKEENLAPLLAFHTQPSTKAEFKTLQQSMGLGLESSGGLI